MLSQKQNNKNKTYKTTGPPPFNTVGLFTYLRTYSRRHDENDPDSTIESWEECITRVVNATNSQLNVGFAENELEELFLVDVLVEVLELDLDPLELLDPDRLELELFDPDRLELLLLEELLEELFELLVEEDVLVETLAELLASELFCVSTN